VLSSQSRLCASLETEPRLQLDDSSGEAVGRAAEASSVDNVRRRLCWDQRCQIQNVEGVKHVSADCELCSLADELRVRQHELLAEGKVHRCVAGSPENIPAAAAGSQSRSIKLGFGIRENAVDPLLFTGIVDRAAKICGGQVRTISVAVPIRIGVAAPDQRGERES
jgi:hypothetical protein